jgi:hypothetical protein
MLSILVVQPSPCPKRVTFISVKVLDAAGITPLQEKSELYITRIVFPSTSSSMFQATGDC